MKKRIISLILVAVMAVLALTGCAYSYDKDDMSNYATFNKDAFLKALTDGSIKIEDADFGVDEDERQLKVLDAIFTTLAKSVDTDDKKTEGTPGKYDILYYCFYYTAEIDGETHIFGTSSMQESKAVKLQLGLSSNEGYAKKIAELVAGEDLSGYIYKTYTSDNSDTVDVKENVVADGDVVYISYTKEYTQKVYDKDGNEKLGADGKPMVETKKEKVEYKRVVIEKASTDPFISHLAGLSSLTVNKSQSFTIKETIDKEEQDVEYSSVKVNWIVDEDDEIGTVTDVTYDKENTTTDKKEIADIYGVKYDLKNKELTYHVFPVYYLSVPAELTAELVLDEFYSSVAATEATDDEDDEDGKKYSFDCVENGGYKKGDKTLADLAGELSKLKGELKDAEEELEDAEKDVEDAGSKATESQKKAVENAKKEVEKAEKAVDDKIKEILECTNDKDGKIADDLVDGLKKYQYKTLEKTYKSSVKSNIAVEVFELAEKYITYKKDADGRAILPWKAVNAAYERIENSHKYDFYEEEDSEKKESYYKIHNGSFDSYLKSVYFDKKASTATMQDVYDKMGEEAEESVRQVILVYTLAELYGEEVDVTSEQIDEFKQGFYYYYMGDAMEESDYMTALLFDNIFNHILEETAEDDYTEDKDYGKNKVQYIRVKYGFDVAEDK